MKRFSQQFKKSSESIRLSAAEKRDLKERLHAYMEYHPLPATTKAPTAKIASESFVIWRFNTSAVRASLGAFAAILFIFVPVVAERAVPGDVLYPIKVQFNEEVRSTLTLSPYEKVEWETERLERRIAEARLLADEGKLTDEVAAEVAEAVKAHSDAAQAEIDTIRETDTDEAAIAGIALTSALEVQSEVLEQDLEAAGVDGEGDVLAVAVEAARADAEAAQAEELPSYEKLQARIESETTRAQEFLNSLEEVISDEDRAEVERRLSDIVVKITAATEAYDAADAASVTATVEQLSEVLASIRKLISFMTDIDVKETVEVEDLVPVTLTPEERVAAVEAALVTIAADEAAVNKLVPQVTDAALLEKVTFGLATVAEQVGVAGENLSTSTIAAAETAVDEAEALLADMLFALALAGADRVPDIVIDTGTTTASSSAVTASSSDELIDPADEITEDDDAAEAEEIDEPVADAPAETITEETVEDIESDADTETDTESEVVQ